MDNQKNLINDNYTNIQQNTQNSNLHIHNQKNYY